MEYLAELFRITFFPWFLLIGSILLPLYIYGSYRKILKETGQSKLSFWDAGWRAEGHFTKKVIFGHPLLSLFIVFLLSLVFFVYGFLYLGFSLIAFCAAFFLLGAHAHVSSKLFVTPEASSNSKREVLSSDFVYQRVLPAVRLLSIIFFLVALVLVLIQYFEYIELF